MYILLKLYAANLSSSLFLSSNVTLYMHSASVIFKLHFHLWDVDRLLHLNSEYNDTVHISFQLLVYTVCQLSYISTILLPFSFYQ